ncbi:hypothetical protein ABZ914_47550, partial [Spirillospora sp. NPDC046719]
MTKGSPSTPAGASLLLLLAAYCAAAAAAPVLVRALGRGAFPPLAAVVAPAAGRAVGAGVDGGAPRAAGWWWVPGRR